MQETSFCTTAEYKKKVLYYVAILVNDQYKHDSGLELAVAVVVVVVE